MPQAYKGRHMHKGYCPMQLYHIFVDALASLDHATVYSSTTLLQLFLGEAARSPDKGMRARVLLPPGFMLRKCFLHRPNASGVLLGSMPTIKNDTAPNDSVLRANNWACPASICSRPIPLCRMCALVVGVLIRLLELMPPFSCSTLQTQLCMPRHRTSQSRTRPCPIVRSILGWCPSFFWW